MTHKMMNWNIFIKERFPLPSHLLMILLFVGGHLALLRSAGTQVLIADGIIVFLAILIFFFKMRLYDEIKDYDLDCQINKDRPLPRGLLKVSDVKNGIWVCLVLEISLMSLLGVKATLSFMIAIFYSLLMYKEFFIPKLLRPHLTTYAVSHTIVTIPMSLAIFSALTERYSWNMPSHLVYFSLANWLVFNIFEFGRKTFSTQEERNAVESYSKIFHRWGAVLLVLSMAAGTLPLLAAIQNKYSSPQIILFFSLLLSGAIFAISDKERLGKFYRGFSSIYIILFYFIFIYELTLGTPYDYN